MHLQLSTAETAGNIRRLRVLNVLEEGRYGGPQKRVVDVAVRLRERHGIETIVLLPTRESERFQEELTRAGVPFHAIGLHRLTKDPWHLAGYVALFAPEVLRIRRVIRRLRPDVVHCNGSYQVKGMLAASLAGSPRVWHMNDSAMPVPVGWLFSAVRGVAAADRFIVASERTRAYYFPSGRESEADIRLIESPVNTAQYRPDLTAPNPFPDPEFDGVRVLAIGNVNPVKNHELLVHVAAQLERTALAHDVRFYVAGAIFQNQEAYHRRLLDGAARMGVRNLVFLGSRTDVPALLAHADIVTCTSTSEGSPNCVWEAMATGKPVVSTDVGDVRTVFESRGCGLVGDSHDASGFAALVRRLIESPEERTEMGRRGRSAAIELFDVAGCASKHAAFYSEVAASSEGGSAGRMDSAAATARVRRHE